MHILSIDIERQDHGACCGLLEFGPEPFRGVLLWTVQWDQGDGLLVEFFPGTAFEDHGLIKHHQQQLVGGLLETLAQRLDRESLPH